MAERRLCLLGLATTALVLTLGAASPPPSSWTEAARAWPVAAEGRILPLDTWAAVVWSRFTGRDRDPAALTSVVDLLVFPDQWLDRPFLLVADPAVVAPLGIVLEGPGLQSPRALAPALAVAETWQTEAAADPSPGGQERLRLARALVLYKTLAATFVLSSPVALRSPLASFSLADRRLNPAQALADPGLTAADKDRLGLLLYWLDRSKARDWTEAEAALRVFCGTEALLEVVHNTIPWAALTSLAALGGLGWWLVRRRRGPGLGIGAGVAAGVLTLWLVVRMVISGRPPVTNLAGTFLLVAWLAAAASTALSFRKDQEVSALLALGAAALLPWLVPLFQTGSDPFSPLQAVLNTNFWLVVHVSVIVSGYACALAAGLLGHAYLVAAQARGGGTRLVPLWKNLHLALGTALVLTITGTLLGGFWADQSWGRFWGWDPKENGALMLILWLALTLHLRPARLAQEWGTAVAAAVLIPVLLFSWLGVNLLGVGFHSYGAAPGKALVFVGLLALDALFLSFVAVRRALR